MPLPATFPPDTLFALGKGIPMTRPGETSWAVLRWDTDAPEPISPAFWMFARELDEAGFREAVEAAHRPPLEPPLPAPSSPEDTACPPESPSP